MHRFLEDTKHHNEYGVTELQFNLLLEKVVDLISIAFSLPFHFMDNIFFDILSYI